MGKRENESRYVPSCLPAHSSEMPALHRQSPRVIIARTKGVVLSAKQSRKSLQFIYTQLHLHPLLLHPTILAS